MVSGFRGLMYAADVDASTIRALSADSVGAHAESVGYHAQQMAEKMLKAAFASKEIDFPFTHNIRTLLARGEEAGLFCKPAEEVVEAALFLTSLISVTRYAEAPDFQEGEAIRAINSANRVALFLRENGFESIEVNVPDAYEGEV